jgi:hypothetical protein
MSNKQNTAEKTFNRTVVTCTDSNQRVKATIVSKNEDELVVDLPAGFQMTLNRRGRNKFYTYRVGTLEFVSDGWPVS